MPVHAYGGSISVNATRTVAAGGKIKIAPGNAEAKQVEAPYPGGQEKMPVHAYGGSISVNVTRTVAEDGKIKIAPGNAEAEQVEDPCF